MKTKKSFPYIALYIMAIAAGSLVSFSFKFFTDNPYNFWNVVVPSGDMDGRRALVIDDEVHFRYFLRVLLEKAGFAVKMARNGIEALDVLRSWRPDVITLDVMMPEVDGLTACRTIREFSDVSGKSICISDPISIGAT